MVVTEDRGGGSLRTAISNEIVHLYVERFGRGAEQARTIVDGDHIVVVLEGILTQAESSLIQRGEEHQVDEQRLLFQRQFRDRLIEIIERHSGRRVRSFASGVNARESIASEVFTLVSDHQREGSR